MIIFAEAAWQDRLIKNQKNPKTTVFPNYLLFILIYLDLMYVFINLFYIPIYII